jgi:hypothetical protein
MYRIIQVKNINRIKSRESKFSLYKFLVRRRKPGLTATRPSKRNHQSTAVFLIAETMKTYYYYRIILTRKRGVGEFYSAASAAAGATAGAAAGAADWTAAAFAFIASLIFAFLALLLRITVVLNVKYTVLSAEKCSSK